MSVTVYGASDDLIEVEGDIREEFTAGDIRDGGQVTSDAGFLAFDDGTVLRIVYTLGGVWRITPVLHGKAELVIAQAPEDDEDNYTDRATLDGQIRSVVFGSEFALAAS